jgi:hypothetical protein
MWLVGDAPDTRENGVEALRIGPCDGRHVRAECAHRHAPEAAHEGEAVCLLLRLGDGGAPVDPEPDLARSDAIGSPGDMHDERDARELRLPPLERAPRLGRGQAAHVDPGDLLSLCQRGR